MLAALGNWPGAVWLQGSGTAYLFVNAAHILGIGLLLGAVLPLDLRLMGCFRAVPLAVIGPFLSRAALAGLCLAVPTGLWLFSVRPAEYAGNAAFLWKLGLIALALGNVALQHAGAGFRQAIAGGALTGRVRLLAGISALLWLGALVAGRWIGFL
ncbi:DUF2214 domain-containing protein [Ancylobacter sp. A5.8]|uniref:DUF2214 domain-containing protein n=1 Tax=Ancylobacter gelatini TaxID=2919920 RepID=UPI001F4DF719|nr:DUF2214 domain-containing protein [Ancylobacter gelatini]MCJ8143712.1 DUF2214 domain-containing protein [Ancylobacter gelatini]